MVQGIHRGKFKVKTLVKGILGVVDYDRKGEKKVHKSISLFHSGNEIKKLYSLRMYNSIQRYYSCGIWPGITVGKNLYIAHMHNIYIGKTSIIGDDCKIYPGVMLIANLKNDEALVEANLRRHPKVGNRCVIGANSMLLGPIEIGDNVMIGAGAIVTKDIPAGAVVTGVNNIKFR